MGMLGVGGDMVLHTGDIVHNGWFEQYRYHYMMVQTPLFRLVPHLHTSGNHEQEGGAIPFDAYFPVPGGDPVTVFDAEAFPHSLPSHMHSQFSSHCPLLQSKQSPQIPQIPPHSSLPQYLPTHAVNKQVPDRHVSPQTEQTGQTTVPPQPSLYGPPHSLPNIVQVSEPQAQCPIPSQYEFGN